MYFFGGGLGVLEGNYVRSKSICVYVPVVHVFMCKSMYVCLCVCPAIHNSLFVHVCLCVCPVMHTDVCCVSLCPTAV